MIDITASVIYLMEIHISIEPFGFAVDVLGQKENLYCQQFVRDCFATHHESLVRHPGHVCPCRYVFVCFHSEQLQMPRP